ncbi:efflux RND transporter periplasmic adaptor subunit [Staphylospora marina]|uniref:efflux RND transporter periplasmic adaptor subunit n=1 Tax=Staphylospora marina TaxID=2490858 RepID=UPI000F5BFAEB|nr:efflux RND transporter periplasmic adaptor subunit [Staphylospora marina]
MRKKIWIGGGIIALVMLMIGLAVWKKQTPDDILEGTRLTPRNLGETFTVSGSVDTVDRQTVHLQPDRGELKKIWVKAGQRVKPGDKLVEYENPTLRAEQEQVELQIRAARVKLNYLEKQKKNLGKPSTSAGAAAGSPMPGTTKDELNQQIELTRLELKQAEKQRELVRERIRRQVVTATIAGTVVEVNPRGGTGADATAPLVQVADLSKILVTANVSEFDVIKLKPGMGVDIRSEAMPDKSWTGKVERIADLPKAQGPEVGGGESQVLYPVEIRPNEALPFRIGTRLIVEIKVTGEQVNALPESAIVEEGDKFYVFVVENGKAVRKEVKIGQRNGEYVQVVSGLTAQETVLADPPKDLRPGEEVTVR